MKQVYADTLFNGLIPVKDIVRTDYGMRATVSETTGPYRRGEQLEFRPRAFVRKTRNSSKYPFNIMVEEVNPEEFPCSKSDSQAS